MLEPLNAEPQPDLRRTKLSGRLRGPLVFTSGILAAFLALLLYNAFRLQPLPLTQDQVQDTVAQVLASATPAPAFSARVYQAIIPSLVLIQVGTPGADGGSEQGVGSGVVISADGQILTSLHVVEGASEIELTFTDGTRSSAHVVAEQPETDIAVLVADTPPPDMVPATLGSSNAMRVGDEAYVVGHPLGLFSSMTAGVISGFDRTFQSDESDIRLEGLIQIDAAVNPGNSGGPLLNRYGQVIGIVTGLANPNDQGVFIGIGFAVPISVAGGAAGLPPY